ncbi:ADP-ribosylglycohydrolase family protein [Kitasatospora sp. NPDC094011]|uniref:ADP-ribosylglycohydrolase family protein n=1 Tax=Kitasatospora sp. NPDC094011 TaxID=3364090 RepID=UPI0038278B74
MTDRDPAATRSGRAAGAVLGAAVGDALGAPYEFGPAGALTARFPSGGVELVAGGGWERGEATDDTQMAVLVAESLLEKGELDRPDVLTSGHPWDLAAGIHFNSTLRAAGNGSLMRAATSAVAFAHAGREATMDAARRIAALTHGDRAAWEGTAIFHELVRLALAGADPLAELPDVLAAVDPDHRERYATVLAPDWHPDRATEPNGAVWPCLGSAVWALRSTDGFERALTAAVDLGGDTDTVAAVTGGLAGARYGLAAIPPRWTEPLHVPLPGSGGRVLRAPDLLRLAERLAR